MVDNEQICKLSSNLNISKAAHQGDIPAKVLIKNKDTFSYVISLSFNNAVNNFFLQDEEKHGFIKTIYLQMNK